MRRRRTGSAPPRRHLGSGVKRETIYAYVSRGLLHSQRHLDGKSSTFDPAEIDRFRRRKADDRPGRLEVPDHLRDHRGRRRAASSYRGHPLGELVDAGHSLRGGRRAAVDTASSADCRAWASRRRRRHRRAASGEGAPRPRDADRPHDGRRGGRRRRRPVPRRPLPRRGGHDGPTSDPRDRRLTPGRSTTSTSDRIAERLWVRLTDADPDQWRLLETALVILADHGMATSTLAARLAASTRAAPHAVLLAGLGPLAGPLHGAASRTVHLMFEDAEAHGADAAIAEVMRRDGKVPGIGHFIHRTRDPRHDILFDALADHPLDERTHGRGGLGRRPHDRPHPGRPQRRPRPRGHDLHHRAWSPMPVR